MDKRRRKKTKTLWENWLPYCVWTVNFDWHHLILTAAFSAWFRSSMISASSSSPTERRISVSLIPRTALSFSGTDAWVIIALNHDRRQWCSMMRPEYRKTSSSSNRNESIHIKGNKLSIQVRLYECGRDFFLISAALLWLSIFWTWITTKKLQQI